MAAGISFYDGAMEIENDNVTTANQPEPKATAGGPIVVPDGIDEGNSMDMPERTGNVVDSPKQGKGSPITGPMDE
jgi:hypothetical protein